MFDLGCWKFIVLRRYQSHPVLPVPRHQFSEVLDPISTADGPTWQSE
jgi:hypothetical protein